MDVLKIIEHQIKVSRENRFLQSGQLSLGELISKVEAIAQKSNTRSDGSEPTVRYDFEYLFPTDINSWRGSYDELALNYKADGDELTVTQFLNLLKSAVGKEFTGYKGGEYIMGESTPIWVANYGRSGNTAVIDVLDCECSIVIITAYREF